MTVKLLTNNPYTLPPIPRLAQDGVVIGEKFNKCCDTLSLIPLAISPLFLSFFQGVFYLYSLPRLHYPLPDDVEIVPVIVAVNLSLHTHISSSPHLSLFEDNKGC